LSGSFAAALLEAVGVGVHLQDVDVVGDAVQQSTGESLGAEDLGPFIEGQPLILKFETSSSPYVANGKRSTVLSEETGCSLLPNWDTRRGASERHYDSLPQTFAST
jgi:hypothetical protein